MLTTYLHYGLLIALAIALVFAAVTDIQRRQIDNWLNAAIALGAPVFWWTSGMALWPDVAWQFGFSVIAAAILIGMYAIKLMGGGDLKLLIALSLWLDPLKFLDMLIVMAIVGGGLAAFFVVRKFILQLKGKAQLPYGVAISAGALWVIAANYIPAEMLAGNLG
ncbi:prepilin peptidase [Erythrobacter sp. JK5]|uniref:A24 family peptidase n=1 Tax=Erythrobacter sp. JK5 TaxID=2829500 RepID=UPI001BA7F4D7|nr:prepilin peptidase [Erythrobacter sp. JK5]QUL36596.1 prepilin peptidase [Erythrobacter sp. JK5]